jgi:sortase A
MGVSDVANRDAAQIERRASSSRPAHRITRRYARAAGVAGIALGAALLLFVVYEVYLTGLMYDASQRDATATLEGRWKDPAQAVAPVTAGDGLVRLYAPALGPGFAATVVEGTAQRDLAKGPGHYSGTALPGQPGNFAVAGHRGTHGAPFKSIDRLQSCDALIVETADRWFVYRVLPLAGEAAGWADGKGTQARCRGVSPLSPPYRDVPGRAIVAPDFVSAVAPVPGMGPGETITSEASLITLTSCEPVMSASERMVVHGILVASYPRAGGRPAELAGS